MKTAVALPTASTTLNASDPAALPYRVVSRALATPHVLDLVLEPMDERIGYRAGQYVVVSDTDGAMPPRSYSIANAPADDGRIRLLVARAEGGITSAWMHDSLHSGDTVIVEGPYGDFTADDSFHGPLLFLAGGCGIAPILALLEAELGDPPSRPRRMTLIASVRREEDLINAARLRCWDRRGRVRFMRTVTRDPLASEPRGRLPMQLSTLAGDLSHHQIYICGGDGFVAACESAARACGAPPGAVHTEIFFSDPVPWIGTSAGVA